MSYPNLTLDLTEEEIKFENEPTQLVAQDSNAITYYQPTANSDSHRRFNQIMRSDTQSARAWFGTYYHDGSMVNSTTVDLSLPFRFTNDCLKYFVGQWERTEQGKLHFHYVAIFNQPVKCSGAKRALDCWRGRLEPSKSDDATLFYATREDKRLKGTELVEFGTPPPGQGRPQGKIEAMKAALDGKSLTYIMENYPDQYARYHAAINKIVDKMDTPRFLAQMPEVYIYWGPTGTGKSFAAYNENPGAYRKILAGKWWDGYNNEETVIFEEFDPAAKNEQQIPEFLKILDRYPYRIEIKGGSMQLKAKKFIFTTNINPSGWWNGHPQVEAFHRRITKIEHFTTPGDSTKRTPYKFIQ